MGGTQTSEVGATSKFVVTTTWFEGIDAVAGKKSGIICLDLAEISICHSAQARLLKDTIILYLTRKGYLQDRALKLYCLFVSYESSTVLQTGYADCLLYVRRALCCERLFGMRHRQQYVMFRACKEVEAAVTYVLYRRLFSLSRLCCKIVSSPSPIFDNNNRHFVGSRA